MGKQPNYARPTAIERFWARVLIGDGCWLWNGPKNSKGYIQFASASGTLAHRFAYEYFNGPIPHGMTIDHLCRNRGCVNPDHLEAVSNRDNVLRGIGQTAINARKTHCKRGHAFTADNIRHYRGRRVCLNCWLLRSEIYGKGRTQ
jgi:hypothetical protein